MDYEKAYKEAIERCKSWMRGEHPECFTEAQKAGEFIFPELEESEDKKWRNWLIGHLKGYINQTNDKYAEVCKEAIAWLENQDEQKPVYKSEPKFKVGDWVVHDMSDGRKVIRQIINMTNKSYVLDGEDFNTFYFNDLENDYHLWTIKDAKDSDVVVDKSYGTIGIFQSIGHHPDGGSYNDLSYCFLHCRYDDEFFYADFENGNTMASDDAIPATKEQRDLLFQKMKEAGYEWDAEEKELKKIEQKPTEWSLPYEKNETADKLIALAECLEMDGDCLFNGLSGNDYGKFLRSLAIELTQPKKEWSEEDDLYLLKAIECAFGNGYLSVSDWLKSIKDRVQPQPKQEWSEDEKKPKEKTKIYDSMDDLIADAMIDEINESNMTESSKHNRVYWVNSHRNKNIEWSKEDEKIINDAIWLIEHYATDGHKKLLREQTIDKLKSLKPNNWKPSEEQMKVLEEVKKCGALYYNQKQVLESLYEELKNL